MDPRAPRATAHDLTHPDVVAGLRALLGDDGLVHTAVTTYRTWEAFAGSSAADRAHLFGHHLVVDIPATPPPVPLPPPGVAAVTRYTDTYPQGLLEHPQPPALLYVAGDLPTGPMVSVVGAVNPTPAGVEITRAAAHAAAAARIPVVVALTPGCPTVAARAVLEHGGRLVLVLPHGFGVGSMQQVLLEETLDRGGAVVSPFPPHAQISEPSIDRAGTVAVLAADAVVLAEVGTVAGAARVPTTAAVQAGKYLIVPKPPAPPEAGRYIAPTAFGAAVFSSAREWSAEYFGSSARITSRCAHGLTPADAVVSNPAEIAAALTDACTPRPQAGR